MTDTLGFGILGAGLVCPFHAKSIRAADGGELVAICDVDKERADRQSAAFGVKALYDLDDLLKEPGIDIVNVITPNHLHHEAVLKCAEAGKHVICEKPPAMSLAETDEMIAACKNAGVKFACTVQCRVRDSIQAMKATIDSGRFGRLLHVDAYMKWFRATDYYHSDPWRSSRKSGAGVTVQHAFHYIDLVQYLGGPVKRVEARMSNLAHPSVELEDTLAAFLEFENNARGVVQASTALWPGTDVRVEVNGERGTAIVGGEKMQTWAFKDEQPEDDEIRRFGSADQKTAAGGAADFGHQDHQAVIQDTLDAVFEDREVIIPMATVRHSLEVALAMYLSDARGEPVDLPLPANVDVWR